MIHTPYVYVNCRVILTIILEIIINSPFTFADLFHVSYLILARRLGFDRWADAHPMWLLTLAPNVLRKLSLNTLIVTFYIRIPFQ